ncbi:putative toxin-antitoxin system toxin component, PIN family [Flavonifractor plautii]|uniref:putative toxin-antitoxin system toxin component, PIN family n=1 Tax=Flavonifractor plautii TaxID=292800 RepID=UPI001D083046|nr:putative toxin-antitoxin system toxin component, PIN family [Flavonifractor plautii]MCB7042302.1 putative toxin-antitoxin system toxin component, PIN family [Flavonifractor plautii]
MRYFAVLDTNVLVSALLNKSSVPAMILDEAADGSIAPLYDDDILAEYEDVLHRKKFPFAERDIRAVIEAIKSRGIHVEAGAVDVTLPDMDDVIFYAVVMEKRKETDAYLVTGNLKHFPKEPFIVTPREMLDIITNGEQ